MLYNLDRSPFLTQEMIVKKKKIKLVSQQIYLIFMLKLQHGSIQIMNVCEIITPVGLVKFTGYPRGERLGKVKHFLCCGGQRAWDPRYNLLYSSYVTQGGALC